jgi:hypothetical protein
MDPDVIVTILFVAYAVAVCAGIGGVVLTQGNKGAPADNDGPQAPDDCPSGESHA